MQLNKSRHPLPGGRHFAVSGFTLIELMVAMVVGLVVVLAAVTFIVSVARANSEDIQVTRLNQELRSLSEVISRELRRARYVADPIALAGQGPSVTAPHDAVNISANRSCVTFSYDDPPNPGAPVTRSIHLVNGGVFMSSDGTACSGGVQISSPQVVITALQFTPQPNAAALQADLQVDQVITGQLSDAKPPLDTVSRTFRHTIYLRSGQVN